MSVFDSSAPRTLQSLADAEIKALHSAQRRHDTVTGLLRALPAQTPTPAAVNDFGYCANTSMRFDDATFMARLLELYPPVALVDVTGASRSQKPESYLREQEANDYVVPIHPVLLKYESKAAASARWWSRVADFDVEITVKGVRPEDLGIDLERFDAYEHSYATGQCSFYRRKLAQAPGRLDSLELWQRAWADFADRNGFHAARRAFVNIIATQVRCTGEAFSQSDLPEPNYLQAGTAVPLDGNEDAAAVVEALQRKQRNRTAHAWDRVGDFHQQFSANEVAAILEFSALQAATLPDARKQARQEFEHVKAWLTSFFAERGPLPAAQTCDLSKYVEQLCRKATGLLVHLSATSRRKGEVAAAVYIGNSRDATEHLTLACLADELALRPQDLEVDFA